LAPVVAGHRSSTGEMHDRVVGVKAEEAFHVTLGKRLGGTPGYLLVGMGHASLLSSVGLGSAKTLRGAAVASKQASSPGKAQWSNGGEPAPGTHERSQSLRGSSATRLISTTAPACSSVTPTPVQAGYGS